jgi:hypothetical protein
MFVHIVDFILKWVQKNALDLTIDVIKARLLIDSNIYITQSFKHAWL